MRTGDTQSVPTSTPNIYVEIQTGIPEDVSALVVKFNLDEQLYGGLYEIWLDNADSALAAKDYVGYKVDLELGFTGGIRSQFPDLWVDTQEFISIPGKLTLKLNCIDAWGLLAKANTTAGAQYWNYPELAPGLPDANATYYDKTIEQIITSIIQEALDNTFAIDDDDAETYFNTLKPPISITNARTGTFQLMSMTGAYLLYKNDMDFHVIKPSNHASVYTFTLGSNQFWIDSEQSAVTTPNRVIFWGTSIGGSSGDIYSDYTSGYGVDSTSYTRLGIYIDEHYYANRMEVGLISDQTLLNNLAISTIANIQGQRSQGVLVAPMHCSLELLDAITITDTRYSGTKTITGYVHHIIREYISNEGIYRITVYLGGIASGYTPSGGEHPMRKPVAPEPSPIGSPFTPLPAYLPVVIDVPFVSVDQDDISWTAGGTIKTASGRVFTITAAGGNTLNLANASVYYLYYDTITNDGTIDSTQTFGDTVSTRRILVGFAKKGATASDPALIVIGSQGQDLFIDKLSAITADMGLLNAGEIRVGTGTLGSNFTGWRMWVDTSVGRMGGYSSDVLQWYSDTDGKLYAGAGNIVIDAGGLKVKGGYLSIYSGANQVGYLSSATAEFIIAALINNKLFLHGDPITLAGDEAIFDVDAAATPFHPDVANYGYLGSATRYWNRLYLGIGGVQMKATGLSHMYDIHPYDAFTWLGASTEKFARGYFAALPACPVPTSNSGIDVIKKIKPPRLTEGKQGFRHYFLDEDFPDELKIDIEEKVVTEAVYEKREVKDKHGEKRFKDFEVSPRKLEIKKTGEREIEFIRTIGVLVQANRELIQRIEALEAR